MENLENQIEKIENKIIELGWEIETLQNEGGKDEELMRLFDKSEELQWELENLLIENDI